VKQQLRTIFIASGAVIAAVAGAITWSITSAPPIAQTAVTFHLDSDFGSSLIRVAAAEGIFAKHGVKATLTDYPDGATAMKEMVSSPKTEIALASSSGTAFEATLPQTQSIRIVSQLANNDDNYYWVVKKGKGNGTVEGLKGLRLGYPDVSGYRTFEEFSLQDHGIARNQVTLVPMPADKFASAMAAGTIDAHPSRILLTAKTLTAVNGAAYALHDVGAYNFFEVLSVSKSTAAIHSKIISAVLAALVDAQTISYSNPIGARSDIAKSLGITLAEVPKNIFDTVNIRLSNGLLRQLLKNRALLASDAGLAESKYFNSAQELLAPKMLQAVDPLVVHLG
jgi:ABC-type nitrate/sulfonate/bicarbonate transport system substrate-binding protein